MAGITYPYAQMVTCSSALPLSPDALVTVPSIETQISFLVATTHMRRRRAFMPVFVAAATVAQTSQRHSAANFRKTTSDNVLPQHLG